MPTVLMALRAALDPTGVALSTWNSTAGQPCSVYNGQPNNRPGTYGKSWRGVTCNNVYAAPSLGRKVYGGVATLDLAPNFGLTGTIPVELAELRTATQILLNTNNLQGTLPSSWGSQYLPSQYLPPSLGFDMLSQLYLHQVRAWRRRRVCSRCMLLAAVVRGIRGDRRLVWCGCAPGSATGQGAPGAKKIASIASLTCINQP